MLFRIVYLNNLDPLFKDYIWYNINYYEDIEEVLDYGKEYINIEYKKPIDYLYSICQVTKDLPEEIRSDIFYRALIEEFRERYFIEKFNRLLFEDLTEELDLLLYLSYSSDHTNYSLESWYYSE